MVSSTGQLLLTLERVRPHPKSIVGEMVEEEN
jgi:hypothetical protein